MLSKSTIKCFILEAAFLLCSLALNRCFSVAAATERFTDLSELICFRHQQIFAFIATVLAINGTS